MNYFLFEILIIHLYIKAISCDERSQVIIVSFYCVISQED